MTPEYYKQQVKQYCGHKAKQCKAKQKLNMKKTQTKIPKQTKNQEEKKPKPKPGGNFFLVIQKSMEFCGASVESKSLQNEL